MAAPRDAAALVGALALVGLAAFSPRAVVDNSVEALLAAQDAGAERYRRFVEIFGTDDLVLARLSSPPSAPIEPLIEHTRTIAERLAADATVEHVVDPTKIYGDTIAVLTDEVFREDADAVAAAKRALGGPLGRRLGLLELDADRHVATVVGFARAAPPAERERLAVALEEARAAALADGVTVRLAGPPLLNLTLDRAGRDVAAVALPLLIGVCLIVCLLTLRSVRATATVFLPVGLTVLASDGAYGLTGWTTNLVVDIAKPLLFVLLLAGALHLAAAYRDAFDGDPHAAARTATRTKARAALLALVTTAIGFGSLALSPIAPIRRFGLVTAVGLLAGMFTVVVLVPAVAARLWPRPRPLAGDPIATIAQRAVMLGARLGPVALAVAALIAVAGGWAFSRLPTEPHAIRYFAADHPLRADSEALEADGLGLATVELIVTATAPLTSARALAALDELGRRVEALDGVQSVVSLPVVLREAAYRARGTDQLPEPAFARTILDERPRLLDQLLTKDEKTARLAATIRTLDADELDRLAAAVAALELPIAATVQTTGSYQLLLGAQRGLLETLTESLVVTFLLMQLILIVAVRSVRIGLIAIVPNLVPVALGFVMMTVLDIKLDIGTTMTAAIALGIAVDDTLHFTLAARAHGIREAARVTGFAIVTSSLVVSAGFFVLMTSSFGPTRNFGLLAGTAMVWALLADLIVLPGALGIISKE